jgi:uncharacterized protein YaiI (UPF0178 family)
LVQAKSDATAQPLGDLAARRPSPQWHRGRGVCCITLAPHRTERQSGRMDAAPTATPRLLVDADACPVREEAVRVAGRLGLSVVLVTNGARPVRPPNVPFVQLIVVSEGADKADDWIAEAAGPTDICLTADIPLAARCLARGALALSFKGLPWTTDNIGSALAGREIARHLRETGVSTGGPAPMSARDRSRFLGALDAMAQAALRRARG